MTIVPDTKDWTWVLGAACPECGLDTRTVTGPEVPGMVRVNAQAWLRVLAAGDPVRVRPAPGVWSPLEYACHVRDVLVLFDARLGRMLAEDDPLFDNWDQDATAVAARYAEQDPAEVAVQLSRAAGAIARSFEAVDGEQWQRPGRRSDGARFTVETFARYFVHDIVHHVHDVTPQD
jgi:hypothetical protein